MCAIEKGTYDGNATFKSGSITIEDATIKDWNNTGFGTISFDKGFEYSSNVGVSHMFGKFINKNDLRDCLTKYGFGKITGVDLSGEVSGKLGFKYPVEVANAGFGQGITTTAFQHLQALSIIANNGKPLTPHIVSKIVNTNNGKTTYKRKVEEGEVVASQKTINKIKSLMYNVVNSDDPLATGKRYQVEGFDIIGKTGTAQKVGENGKYMENNYILSFIGFLNSENPEYIVYIALDNPKGITQYGGTVSAPIAKNIMKNIILMITFYRL